MSKYKVGNTYLDLGASYETFPITEIESGWEQKIEVYGDIELRDRIVRLLNEDDARQVQEQRTKLLDQISEHQQKIEDLRDELHKMEGVV